MAHHHKRLFIHMLCHAMLCYAVPCYATLCEARERAERLQREEKRDAQLPFLQERPHTHSIAQPPTA